MKSILAAYSSEGFRSEVVLTEDETGELVSFDADGDIDADGANGQHGQRAAYMTDNRGSELLANGGMAMRGGKVVGVTSWWTDIVLAGQDGNPLVLEGGVIPSMTAYKYPKLPRNDPARYVDSETIPGIVVPPVVLDRTAGIVLGCKCKVTHLPTGVSQLGVVFDVGPRAKIGEISMQMARSIGVNPSPRIGGEERKVLRYEIWPGVPAEFGGHVFILQRKNGTYLV